MEIKYKSELDATGLYCPEPVMMLHNAVRELDANDVLKVTATDPSTQRDIPKFCQFLGHMLMGSEQIEDTFIYFIKIQRQ